LQTLAPPSDAGAQQRIITTSAAGGLAAILVAAAAIGVGFAIKRLRSGTPVEVSTGSKCHPDVFFLDYSFCRFWLWRFL